MGMGHESITVVIRKEYPPLISETCQALVYLTYELCGFYYIYSIVYTEFDEMTVTRNQVVGFCFDGARKHLVVARVIVYCVGTPVRRYDRRDAKNLVYKPLRLFVVERYLLPTEKFLNLAENERGTWSSASPPSTVRRTWYGFPSDSVAEMQTLVPKARRFSSSILNPPALVDEFLGVLLV